MSTAVAPVVWQNRIVGYGLEAPDQLLANPWNWRIHSQFQQDALAGVLTTVGIVQNVIVNRVTGHIVDGHLRVTLALRTSQPLIPVTYVELSEDEEKLILSTLDPIGAAAATDSALLADLLADVQTGEAAVQRLLESLRVPVVPMPGAGGDDYDGTPTAGETRCQPGDILALGANRLACIDSTDREAVAALMGGQVADLMLTDPPYGIAYHRATWDDKSNEDNLQLVQSVFALAPTARVWTPGKPNLMRDYAWHPTAKVLCWTKGFSPAGNGLGGASTWEPILVVDPPRKQLKNDHLEYRTYGDPAVVGQHPSPKPVALWAELVEAFTDKGMLIYDPFLGSGTTLIATYRTGRICYGCEISPTYADVICRRWEAEAGQPATLVRNIHDLGTQGDPP